MAIQDKATLKSYVQTPRGRDKRATIPTETQFGDIIDSFSELPEYAVAGLPAAADNFKKIVYVSDGAAGSPVLAFSDGTDWLRSDTLTAVSAT